MTSLLIFPHIRFLFFFLGLFGLIPLSPIIQNSDSKFYSHTKAKDNKGWLILEPLRHRFSLPIHCYIPRFLINIFQFEKIQGKRSK